MKHLSGIQRDSSGKRKIHIQLSRDQWDSVVEALNTPDGDGAEHYPSTLIGKEIANALDEYCDSPARKHHMVHPEDNAHIVWGSFGICEYCFVVRRMPVDFNE